MISHGAKITEIMKNIFNIDLSKYKNSNIVNDFDYVHNCDIFEIKLNSNNTKINYYKNNFVNVSNTTDYIDETLSTIDFNNPTFSKTINRSSRFVTVFPSIVFCIKHAHSWRNIPTKYPNIYDLGITDGNKINKELSNNIINEVNYNGISMAKNTAINLYNYIKEKYILNNNFYFVTSPCKRTIQTLFYFQQIFKNVGQIRYYENIEYKYDIFPNIEEGIIDNVNISKGIYYNYFNNMSNSSEITMGEFLDESEKFTLTKYYKNANWNFCNSFYLNNENYDFYDTLIIYLEWKICI